MKRMLMTALTLLLVGPGASLQAQTLIARATDALGQSPISDVRFDYVKQAITTTDRIEAALDEQTKNYRVHTLSFPSVGENGQEGNLVSALYYQSERPGKKRLVIVLPIWGTHTYPSEKITESLLRYSDGEMNVLRILGKDYLIDWQALHAARTAAEFIALNYRMVERVRTHVIDIRRAVDWAEAQPEVDSRRIGLIGFSMGANVASVALAHEPRIAAAALVMGGANPHEMLTSCFGRARKLRDAITARFGWSVETYQRELERPYSLINPPRFAGQVDPDKVILFEAAFDTCIPKSGRDALWHALGEPKRVIWPWNHKMAFIAMTPLGLNTMRHRIYDFLEGVFAPRAASLVAGDARPLTVH